MLKLSINQGKGTQIMDINLNTITRVARNIARVERTGQQNDAIGQQYVADYRAVRAQLIAEGRFEDVNTLEEIRDGYSDED